MEQRNTNVLVLLLMLVRNDSTSTHRRTSVEILRVPPIASSMRCYRIQPTMHLASLVLVVGPRLFFYANYRTWLVVITNLYWSRSH